MSQNRFPQAEQMADESMVRNLREQALAIWPLEAALYDRYGLEHSARILDVGCGTGEIAARLARRFKSAQVLGHAPSLVIDVDRLWHDGVLPYGRATRTDLRIGRHCYQILRELELVEISIDYLTVDTQRAPRAAFAGIMTAWRDGYAPAIAEKSQLDYPQVIKYFDSLIDSINDENQYVVWQVPVASARKAE